MGMLVFACPRTGRQITSGVHTDGASLAKVRSLPVKVYCQTCNTTHLMRAGDGQIEGDSDVRTPFIPADPVRGNFAAHSRG